MKLDCNVIRDLMPLYKDEVCSDESKALVEEHLQECGNCKKALQLMLNDVIEQENEKQGENDFENLKVKVNKKNRKKIRIAVVVSAVVVLAAFLVSRLFWSDVLLVKTIGEVTQARAVTVMPTVIITGEEYALAGKLLQSDDIQAAIESDELAVTLDESVSSEFIGQIRVDGKPVDSVTVSVVSDMVYLEYAMGNCRYYLGFTSADDIIKTAAQYKKNKEVKHFFENYNNTTYKEYYSVRDWFPQT